MGCKLHQYLKRYQILYRVHIESSSRWAGLPEDTLRNCVRPDCTCQRRMQCTLSRQQALNQLDTPCKCFLLLHYVCLEGTLHILFCRHVPACHAHRSGTHRLHLCCSSCLLSPNIGRNRHHQQSYWSQADKPDIRTRQCSRSSQRRTQDTQFWHRWGT